MTAALRYPLKRRWVEEGDSDVVVFDASVTGMPCLPSWMIVRMQFWRSHVEQYVLQDRSYAARGFGTQRTCRIKVHVESACYQPLYPPNPSCKHSRK